MTSVKSIEMLLNIGNRLDLEERNWIWKSAKRLYSRGVERSETTDLKQTQAYK